MSNKEFWEEEPELLWAYRKSYIDKFKIQNELINYEAWLNGLYVFDAISKSIYNSFGRKETQPALNYIEKPYDFDENEKVKSKEEIEREQQLKLEEKIKESLQRTKSILNRNKERQEK